MSDEETRIQRILEERRAAVQEASKRAVKDCKPVQLDQQAVGRLSRIDAIQMQQMAQAAERSRSVELQRIEAALARLAAGDYGVCVRCGEEIDGRRLALDPATPVCVECARQAG